MSISNDRMITVDSRHSTTGGMSSFVIQVPRDVIGNAPKSVKLIDASFYVPNTDPPAIGIDSLTTRLIAPELDAGNNHFIVESLDGTISIDIFLPEVTLVTRPIALPSTQTSAVGPSPINTMVNLASFLQAHLQLWCTPASPVGLGIIPTVTWLPMDVPAQFENGFLITGDFRCKFNTWNSAGVLFGFGVADYIFTAAGVASTQYVQDFAGYNIVETEGTLLLISDLVKGSSNGQLYMNSIEDNRGVFATIVFDQTGALYFRESEVIPYTDIRASRFIENFKNPLASYQPGSLPQPDSVDIHFWLQWPSGIAIDNSFVYNFGFRFKISSIEPDEPDLRIQ